jgi:hypothetical protein
MWPQWPVDACLYVATMAAVNRQKRTKENYFQISCPSWLRRSRARPIIRAMPLSEQEKIGLTQQLAMLLEGNEPEAILATLQRVAERMAHRVTRADITELEALRWQSLADACVSVQRELERANAPRSRQNAPQEAQQQRDAPDAA